MDASLGSPKIRSIGFVVVKEEVRVRWFLVPDIFRMSRLLAGRREVFSAVRYDSEDDERHAAYYFTQFALQCLMITRVNENANGSTVPFDVACCAEVCRQSRLVSNIRGCL